MQQIDNMNKMVGGVSFSSASTLTSISPTVLTLVSNDGRCPCPQDNVCDGGGLGRLCS